MTAKPDIRKAKERHASIPTFIRSVVLRPTRGCLKLRQEAQSEPHGKKAALDQELRRRRASQMQAVALQLDSRLGNPPIGS
jgi:hypothetical protein